MLQLFQSGSAEFVDAIRAQWHADALGVFAQVWYADARPVARELLFEYLARPLNSPRHEALVKRLFKLAEAAGDDAVMARFLVALDRCNRRRRRRNTRRIDWQQTPGGEPFIARANSALPRNDQLFRSNHPRLESFLRGRFLYSVRTRQYLRRRVWRYFRKLGKRAPDRYIGAVAGALRLYRDEDMATGQSLLDNWGLCHILFHYSPTLAARPMKWTLAAGGSLAQLQPDPIYRKLWQANAEPIFTLMVEARARPVSLWALKMLRRHSPERLARIAVPDLLKWLIADNSVLNDLAVELLERASGLEKVPAAEWIALIEAARPDVVDKIYELLTRFVKPEQVPFADAMRLAMQESVLLARLGQRFLVGKSPGSVEELPALFGLREARAEPVRPELVRWAASVLSARADFQPMWVLEFLDARHADVRTVGWDWLQTDERARDEVAVWQRLLESPYDDMRNRIVRLLGERTAGSNGPGRFPAERVRYLWASVLLNIHRGSRSKPYVIRQVMSRLASYPDEAGELLPIVAVALRSVRGPEFRAGLSGIAAFVDQHPNRREMVQAVFPELSWQ